MSNIKIVIPARYKSSRLEGKPLLEINNKPIFWHVYQRCVEAGFSDENIILATDDYRIFNKARELRILVVMTSPHHNSGTDRINEVAKNLKWSPDTLIINVQGDEPLIPPSLIKNISYFSKNRSKNQIITAATTIKDRNEFYDINVVKVILGLNNNALYFTRSASPLNRDEPDNISLAFRHIGIYAYSVSLLSKYCSYPEAPLEKYEKLEQLRALSNEIPIGVCIYDDEPSHGIDTFDDYKKIKIKMELLK